MSRVVVIFPGERSWRVGVAGEAGPKILDVPVAEGSSPGDVARAVREQIDSSGASAGAVVLALPSATCLCAAISTDDLDRTDRRRAMEFRLEEHLPLSAEDLTGDFIETPGNRALGVCVPVETLSSLTDALTAAGLDVRSATPAVLLAAQRWVGERPSFDAMLIAQAEESGETRYDWIEPTGEAMSRWWWLQGDLDPVARRVEELTAESGRALRAGVFGVDTEERPDGAPVEWIPLEADSVEEAATEQAGGVLDYSVQPWVDLADRRNGGGGRRLIRKPLIATLAAAAFLLVSVVAVSQWRGRKYAGLAEDYRRQQKTVFHRTLPDLRLRGSVRRRLRSERRKLAGLGGREFADGGESFHATPSALEHLQALLGNLPDNLRFRILELSIQPDRIRVDGQARTHVEAEQIAVRLRQAGGYRVDPPRTKTLKDRGVSFLFMMTPSGEGEDGGRR